MVRVRIRITQRRTQKFLMEGAKTPWPLSAYVNGNTVVVMVRIKIKVKIRFKVTYVILMRLTYYNERCIHRQTVS